MATEQAQQEERGQSLRAGLSQLSLVEHALCPLDARGSLDGLLTHECQYRYADADKRMQTAKVRVDCLAGLSPADEFYLWGLLALTFEQASPNFDFQATPHYCLRKLGIIAGDSKGGKSYRLFRESLRRLAAVHYQNDRFYDPIRREHRAVAFGFLSYSLPLDPESSRLWRIVWNPLFFEFCQAAGGQLSFDLDTYRELAPASRRLFLLLQKIFWRRATTPAFNLRHLAVDVLGFSAGLPAKTLKAKVKRCAAELAKHDVIAPNAVDSLFVKKAKGEYSVQFQRGVHFRRTRRAVSRQAPIDSPLCDPLKAIGFGTQEITRILKEHRAEQIQLWVDVTLAAIERKGAAFFKRSPQAFFLDNVQRAAVGERTPPDWFLALRSAEQQQRSSSLSRATETGRIFAFAPPADESPDLAGIISQMTAQFLAAGQPAAQAEQNARMFADAVAQKRAPNPDSDAA